MGDRTISFSNRSFAGGVLSLLATEGVLIILSSANGVVTARFLGPEGKGIYTLCILLSAIASLFLSMNIQGANIYLAGKNEHPPSTLLSYSSLMAAVITIFAFALFFLTPNGLIAKIIPNFPSNLWILVGILFPLAMNVNFLSGLILGWSRIGFMNLGRIVLASATLLFFLIFFALGEKTPFYAVMAVIFGTFSANVFLIVPLLREGNILSCRIPASLIKEGLGFGVKGCAGNIFQFFNYRFDILAVNYFLYTSHIGIYAVAVSLAELPWHLPNSVASILFSRVARQQDKYSISFVGRVFRLTWAMVGIGIFFLIFFGKGIIVFIFGKPFAPSYQPMLYLLPGVFFLSMSKVMTGYLNGRGLPQYGSISSFVALFVTVAADIYLIPRLGIEGAAIASSISYTVSSLIVFYFFIKKTDVSVLSLLTVYREDWEMAFSSIRGGIGR